MSDLIRVHSADSHLIEPDDLWVQALPRAQADRAPRFERDAKYETIYLDGVQQMRLLNAFSDAIRPPGRSIRHNVSSTSTARASGVNSRFLCVHCGFAD